MKRVVALLALLVMTACFKPKGYDEALSAFDRQNWDQAASRFAKLVLEYPDDVEFKVKWEMAKSNAAKAHAREGRRAMMKGELDQAAQEFNRSLFYDGTNQYVYDQLNRVMERIEARSREQQRKQTPIEQMEQEARNDTGVPMLSPTSSAPVDLYFPERSSLREIYYSLGQLTGINVLFDSSFQDSQISIDLRGMTFYNALKSLMVASGNFYKVIDEHTIIILKDTKQNHDKYDDKIIKVYYLSYADPTELKNNLRLLTGIKEVFENKDLNCVVVMGTPQQIAIANRIVNLNDKPKAEVLVDFELMEVNRSNLDQLGIMPTDGSNPTYKLGAGLFGSDGESDSVLPGYVDTDASVWKFAVPLLQLDFLKSIGKARDVSSPTLRVSEGETGKVLIGQSVPVATTSFTPFTGSNTDTSSIYGVGGQPLTSYNYQEVGIKIEVEPRVHHNGDISLKMKLEISSIVDNREGFQPVIGKRTVETVLRVNTGEVVVFAGLLKDTERTSLNGIKGLADIPLLGRLFSNTKKEVEQTDIMMTIVPHIVRGPNIRRSDVMPYMVGSEVESNFAPMDPFAKETADQGTLPGELQDNYTSQQPVSSPGHKQLMPPANPQPSPSKTIEEKEQPAAGIPDEKPVAADPLQSQPGLSTIPAMLSMTPRKLTVPIGTTSIQSLFATNFQSVDNVDLVMTYDPEIVEVVDVLDGGFMGEDGTKVSFVPVWDNENGRLSITIDRKGTQKGRSGTGMLANVVFKGRAAGSTKISVMMSSSVEALGGDRLPFKFIDGEVMVQ